MPNTTINIVLETRDGKDVKAEFLNFYGGSEKNWNWLRDTLQAIKPFELKKRCQRLNACDVVRLGPCWVFGHLRIRDEAAWTMGLDPGVFTIDAVVHEDYVTSYYQGRLDAVSDDEQNL